MFEGTGSKKDDDADMHYGDDGGHADGRGNPDIIIGEDGKVTAVDGPATGKGTNPDDIGTGRTIGGGADGGEAGGCPYILVRRTDDNAVIPHAMTAGDAGFDMAATARTVIAPGGRAVVDTGIAVAIPRGYAGFVLSRSGLAAGSGVAVLNAPGLIDSGYRDSVKVILINTGDKPATLEQGDRIAQLVIQRVEDPVLMEASRLPDSDRGENGLGSTGN